MLSYGTYDLVHTTNSSRPSKNQHATTSTAPADKEPEGEPLRFSKLCRKCQPLFEGRWIEIDAWENTQEAFSHETDSNIDDDSQEKDERGDEEAKSDGVDNGSMEALSDIFDGWHERPDWVKVIEEKIDIDLPDLKEEDFYSPAHCSIIGLEESAKEGCSLCIVLWDFVRDRAEEFEDLRGRLEGIVIIREMEEQMGVKDELDLEVQYFIDGKVEEDAWKFSTTGVYLLPCGEKPGEQSYHQPEESSPGPPSQKTLNHIKEWLGTCLKDHADECESKLGTSSESTEHKLPTRLLHAKAGTESPHVSLIETVDLDPATPYAALSHCWGRTPIIRLLTSLYTDFKTSILFSSLSNTFQEAVQFTLLLNLEYIWIDSLCIIQDSASDWMKEATTMCSLYSNSYVTIAATSSHDGNGGLFPSSPHNINFATPCIVQTTWNGHPNGTYMAVDPNAWDRRVQTSPLNSRGWVLQERILPVRTIHCSYDQLYWTCSMSAPCSNSTYPHGVPVQNQNNNPSDPISSMMLYKHDGNNLIGCNEDWLSIVRNYTNRDLTFGKDKLVAISGVAEAAMRIMRLGKEDYLAGFWKVDLRVDLLWRMRGTGNRPVEEGYRAPTWSWASVDGGVYFHSEDVRAKARDNIWAEVVEVEVVPVGDGLGPVKGGHIVLEGTLFKGILGKLEKMAIGDYFLEELKVGGKTYKAGDGFEEALDHDPEYAPWPEEGREVYFACLVSISKEDDEGENMLEGLILERNGESGGEYRRMGWFRIFHDEPGDAFLQRAVRSSKLSSLDYLKSHGGGKYEYRVV